jgi:cytochrome c biogenesis protein
MWVKATTEGHTVRLEYAGLARGEDPTLDAAVAQLAQQHLASLAAPAASSVPDRSPRPESTPEVD